MVSLLAKRVVLYSVSTVTSNQCRSAVLNRGYWASTGVGNYGGVDAMDKKELMKAREKRRAAALSAGKHGRGANQQHGGNRQGTKTGSRISNLAIAATVAVLGGTSCYLKRNELGELYEGSFVERVANSVLHTITSFTKQFTDPISDKLLQDWPPDQPCPPTLVLDLEQTLVAPVYKRGKGWVIAKRPGVSEFLKELSMYYEIVVFTSSPPNVAEEVITSLDKDQCIWGRLYRKATLFENGLYRKDLSKLNRPIERIVIIDDEPECFALQPDNGIAIKPYSIEEGMDPHFDNALETILPFLMALAVENVQDVRPFLRRYKGMTADEIGSEYNLRVKYAKARDAEEQSKGLGGALRSFVGGTIGGTTVMQGTSGISSSSNSLIGDVLQSNAAGVGGYNVETEGKAESRASAGTRTLMGTKSMAPAPPPPKEGEVGGFLRRYREKNKESEDLYRIKMEKWNEIMAKKVEEAAQKQKA